MTNIILSIISALSTGGVIAQFVFYKSKQRKANAEAEEREIANDERQIKLLESRLEARDNKIDKLYGELRKEQKEHMKTLRLLLDKDTAIAILTVQKCVKRGCIDRTPPSEY